MTGVSTSNTTGSNSTNEGGVKNRGLLAETKASSLNKRSSRMMMNFT